VRAEFVSNFTIDLSVIVWDIQIVQPSRQALCVPPLPPYVPAAPTERVRIAGSE